MASTTRKILLKSSDGVTFEMEEAVVALHSQTIKDIMINGGSAFSSGTVALSDVTGNILAKVIEYCYKHSSGDEKELRQWDADFVKVDRDTLFDLLNAANSLKIKNLLNLICHTVAHMMKGMNPQEIGELTMRMKGFTLWEP